MQKKIFDEQYLTELENITYKPIFILGLHRSGTTILYEMLNKTNHFNVVTSYHILNYNKILYNYIKNLDIEEKNQLNAFFKKMRIIDRGFDNIKIDADYAHEYGYILHNYSFSNEINLKNLKLFEEICKKINYISDNNKPLLLKNPYDFTNFVFIKKNIPNVKFIFIVRNPLNIINSTMKMLKNISYEKNLYTALFSKNYNKYFANPLLLNIYKFYSSSILPFGLFRVINQSVKETNFFLNNIIKIHEEDYICIRYEDLCMQTNKIMEQVLDFLNIKSDIEFSQFISTRENKLLPNVKFFKGYIEFKMKDYYKSFNYIK